MIATYDDDDPSWSRLWEEGVTCLDLTKDHHPGRQQPPPPPHDAEGKDDAEEESVRVARRAFDGFVGALPRLRADSTGRYRVPSNQVDAHSATGFHVSGSLRWSATSNLHREGLVWSRRGDGSSEHRTNGFRDHDNRRSGEGGGDGGGVCRSSKQERPSATSSFPCLDAEHCEDDRSDNSNREGDDDDGGDENASLDWLRLWSDPMEELLLTIALRVLDRVERRLELPVGWFRQNMLFDGSSSKDKNSRFAATTKEDFAEPRYHQWHMKNYVLLNENAHAENYCDYRDRDPADAGSSDVATASRSHPTADDGSRYPTRSQSATSSSAFPHGPTADSMEILLPPHTDPSLVSVIILDRPPVHASTSHSQGLEYWNRMCRRWEPALKSNHPDCGNDEISGEKKASGFAIIVIGSVLSYITRGYLHAPLHRVTVPSRLKSSAPNVQQPNSWHRRAATLFLRPSPSALLRVPPSPLLNARAVQQRGSSAIPRKELAVALVTFEEWSARVSKNYRKGRQRRWRAREK
jgi:hypothetical protein